MKVLLRSFLFLIFVFTHAEAFGEVRKIVYRGYTDCYQISNDSVKLIVVAQAGGRVFNFSLNDRNIISEDEALNGKTIVDFNIKTFEPDGGRFDIRGSTSPGKQRDTLWIGPYTTEITSKYSMKMTSLVDKNMGIDICREFILDSTSSHLRIRQTMTNHSNKETNLYFWGRIFCQIGGKIVIPLNPNSRYSSKWGYVDNGVLVSANVTDSLVEALDTILTFRASKNGVKRRYGADPNRGWILYGLNEQILLMKYKVDLTKTYLTEYGESLILYTDGATKVELEPISPAEKLSAGQSYTFEEDWWLFNYPPAKTKDFDGTAAATYALSKATTKLNNNTDIRQVSKFNAGKEFTVFPNPTKGVIEIYGRGLTAVELSSLKGNVILKKTYSGSDEINLLTVDTIPNGIYFVKIYYNNGLDFVTKKICINY